MLRKNNLSKGLAMLPGLAFLLFSIMQMIRCRLGIYISVIAVIVSTGMTFVPGYKKKERLTIYNYLNSLFYIVAVIILLSFKN